MILKAIFVRRRFSPSIASENLQPKSFFTLYIAFHIAIYYLLYIIYYKKV